MKCRNRYLTVSLLAVLLISGCASSPEKPELTEEQKQQEVQSLVARAEKDVESRNYSVALLRYEQALELDSTNSAALLGAGDVAYAMKKYPDAENYYNRVLENQPESIDALEGKALCQMKLGQFQAAKNNLEQLVLTDETRWRSFNALGVLSDLESRYPQAQSYYRKALELNDGNAMILNNLGYSLVMDQKYSEAENVLRQAFARSSGYFRARNNYSIALAWQKKYQEAIDVLVDAVPHEVAYNNVGYIAYLNRDLDSAQFYLKKAISASSSYYPEAARTLEKVEQAMKAAKSQRSLP
ncbi:MAG: tetratricopeptide repeat protein [Gammaproteobacteria bacterium]|nr:tetratricopeptide repeat protein [Gammaproteobacteria bacterium]